MKITNFILFILMGIILIVSINYKQLKAHRIINIVLYNPDLTFAHIETFTTTVTNYLESRSNDDNELALEFFRKNEDLETYIEEQSPSFAIFSSWYYVNNKKLYDANPLLIASKDHKTYYNKIIYVHKDSDIKQLEDLKGKTLALASSGKRDYLYLDKVIFKEEINSKSSLIVIAVPKDMDALLALVMQQVDAALVTAESYELLKESAPTYLEDIEAFYISPPIPMPILCTLEENISQETINHIQDVFLTMDENSLGIESMELLQIDKWIPFSDDYLEILPKEQGYMDILDKNKGYPKINNWELLMDWNIRGAWAEDNEIEAIPNICIIQTDTLKRYSVTIENFQNTLKGNYHIFSLNGKQEADKIIPLINEIKPDIILAIGGMAAAVAKENFSEIPIIFTFVLNPSHLYSPNVTGITMEVPIESQLSSLKFIIPEINTIGIIYDDKYSEDFVMGLEKACEDFKMRLIKKKISKPEEVEIAFESLNGKVDALWMPPDVFTVVTQENFNLLVNKTEENNIPLIAFSNLFVRYGAFFSVSQNDESVGNQAAVIAEEILSGKSPDEIPIAMPIGIAITINLKTAEKIGLDIPAKKLVLVNEIIK